MLTVAYILRQEEDAGGTRVDVFRVISARATRRERQRYEDENG
jgi:uncharacterized DUF497 family protein